MTDIIPKGTKVRYHGSLDYLHGEYTVTGLSDLSLRSDIPGVERDKHWPDGIAYDLWPVGVPFKFDNRGHALHWVRRQSFDVIE